MPLETSRGLPLGPRRQFAAKAVRRLTANAIAIGLAVGVLCAQDTRGVGVRPAAVEVKVGPYHALLIAVQKYADETMPQLERPVADAQQLLDVLTSTYQFERKNIQLLVNPSREGILASLFSLSERLGSNDNLLVFYAGHGYWDARTQQGYWLPTDARKANPSQWISNADIRDALRRISVRHTLLISDACFAGGIFRTRDAFGDSNGAGILRLYEMPSRKAMTSGSKEVVPDRSRFVEYIVKRLRDNTQSYLPASDLFSSLRSAVMNNSVVTPQYGTIFDAGDEGGEFLFPRKPLPVVTTAPAVTGDAGAGSIPARGAVWKNTAGSYLLYVDGERVVPTINSWAGDHLLVFDPLSKRHYLFESYNNRADGQLRPAIPIEAPDLSVWRHLDNSYWLFMEGKALTGLASVFVDDELLVYDAASKRYFLLDNYKNLADGKLHPSQLLDAPDRAIWRGLGTNYWLYVDGTALLPEKQINSWDGDDLVVYDATGNRHYLLENYRNRKDGRLRPARLLDSGDRALWKHEGTNFFLYVEGVALGGVRSAWDGNNLLAYVPASKRYYLLEDYSNLTDGRLRPARYFEAPDQALWKRAAGNYWLFVEGQAVGSLTSTWDGDNLIVVDPASKRRYLLSNYRNRDDGTLRPAVLIKE